MSIKKFQEIICLDIMDVYIVYREDIPIIAVERDSSPVQIPVF